MTTAIGATLFLSVMIMVVGQSFLFTILPPIGREIGLADYQVGVILSSHGFFMLFTGPLWGWLSESRGRKRIIIAGAFLYLISLIMLGLVIEAGLAGALSAGTVLLLMIASRAMFAVGAGAIMPGSMAMAADLTTAEMRLKALSLLAAAASVGAIIGPSVAALFAGFGLTVPFYVIAFVVVAIIGACIFVLPNMRSRSGVHAGGYAILLKRRILIIALTWTVFMVGVYSIFAMLGFFVQDRFELSGEDAARWMGVSVMSAAVTNVLVQTFIVRRVSDRMTFLVISGIPLTFLAFLITYLSDGLPIFILGMVVNGFGQGLATPALNTALSLSVGSDAQGRVAGLSTSAQAAAFLIAPVTGATLYQTAQWAPFVWGMALLLVSLGLFVTGRRLGDIRDGAQFS